MVNEYQTFQTINKIMKKLLCHFWRHHIYIYVYVYVYICIYIDIQIYIICIIYTYVYMFVCIYIYINMFYIYMYVYIYIFIYREREGERKILTGSESTLLHLVSLEVFIILLECKIFLFFLSFIFNVCLFTWLQ